MMGRVVLVAVAAAVLRIVLFAGVELYEDEAYYWLWSRRLAFGYFQMGYASALAWVLFLVVLALTTSQFALGQRWVHYEEGSRR